MGIKSIVKSTAEAVTTKATNTSDTVRGAVALKKQQKDVMRGIGQRLRERKAQEEAAEAAEKAKKAAEEAVEKAKLILG